MAYPDAASFGDLTSALSVISESLDHFNRFEGPDDAGRNRESWKKALDVPLPNAGLGLDAVLEELRSVVIPNGLRNGHPGFNGWVTTAPTTSGTAAALASTVAGSQRFWVQAFNYLETVSLKWLNELLGFPDSWQGTYCSGGSSANLITLGAARQWAVEQMGVDPSMTGMPEGVRWRIYASSEVHHVINRAAAILGIGRRSVTPIPVTDAFTIDVGALKEQLKSDASRGIRPMAIVATAGTVNTGAIDPINELADVAEEVGAWLHVDGAYGMFGILDDRVADLYTGVLRADSVALDPHKWLAAPVGNGVAIVRDRGIMGRAFTLEPASYLEGSASQDGRIESPFDDFGEMYHEFNLDQSAPSRGVQVWAILKEIGKEGMTARVVRHNSYARHLEKLADDHERLEVVSKAVISICCFRYNNGQLENARLNELNAEIAAHLRADGSFVPSTTVVGDVFAIRPCYINPRTRLEDVEGLANRVVELGDKITASSPH